MDFKIKPESWKETFVLFGIRFGSKINVGKKLFYVVLRNSQITIGGKETFVSHALDPKLTWGINVCLRGMFVKCLTVDVRSSEKVFPLFALDKKAICYKTFLIILVGKESRENAILFEIALKGKKKKISRWILFGTP